MKSILWRDKDIRISAQKFPDRKRPALCITEGKFVCRTAESRLAELKGGKE